VVPVSVSAGEVALAAVVALLLLALVGLITVAAAAGVIRETPDPYASRGGEDR
jgi:hypothetical protein